MVEWAPGACTDLGYQQLVGTSANATEQRDPEKCDFKSWGGPLPASLSLTQWVANVSASSALTLIMAASK